MVGFLGCSDILSWLLLIVPDTGVQSSGIGKIIIIGADVLSCLCGVVVLSWFLLPSLVLRRLWWLCCLIGNYSGVWIVVSTGDSREYVCRYWELTFRNGMGWGWLRVLRKVERSMFYKHLLSPRE